MAENILASFTSLSQQIGQNLLDVNSLLVLGKPKSGKRLLLKQLTADALLHNCQVIYVSGNKGAVSFYNDMIRSFPDIKTFDENWMIIDCFGSEESKLKHPEVQYCDFRDLGDLEAIIKHFSRGFEGKTLMIIDSLSTALIYNAANPVSKFIKSLLAHSEAFDGICLSTLSLGSHSTEDIAVIENLMDTILHINIEDKKFEIKGTNIPAIKIKYHITKQGFKIIKNKILSSEFDENSDSFVEMIIKGVKKEN